MAKKEKSRFVSYSLTSGTEEEMALAMYAREQALFAEMDDLANPETPAPKAKGKTLAQALEQTARRFLTKANPFHEPAGSGKGGQFARKPAGAGGGKGEGDKRSEHASKGFQPGHTIVSSAGGQLVVIVSGRDANKKDKIMNQLVVNRDGNGFSYKGKGNRGGENGLGFALGPVRDFITIPMTGMLTRDTMDDVKGKTGTDISTSLAKVRIRYPLIVENQRGTYGQMKRGDLVEQLNLDPDRFNQYYDKGAMVISSLEHKPEFHQISVERLGNDGDPDFTVLHRAPRPSSRVQSAAATLLAVVPRRGAAPAARKVAKPRPSPYAKKEKMVNGVHVSGEVLKSDEKDFKWLKYGDVHDTVGHILGGIKTLGFSVHIDGASATSGRDYKSASFSAKLLNGTEKVADVSRVFVKAGKTLTVNHSYFEVEKSYQKKGIAKELFRHAFKEYQKLKVDHVEVGAGLTRGGYAWARFGFLPSKDDWGYVLERAKRVHGSDKKKMAFLSKLSPDKPKDAWLLADSKYGNETMSGSGWHGTLDMKNKEQMDRFWRYVGGSPVGTAAKKAAKRPAKKAAKKAARKTSTRVTR